MPSLRSSGLKRNLSTSDALTDSGRKRVKTEVKSATVVISKTPRRKTDRQPMPDPPLTATEDLKNDKENIHANVQSTTKSNLKPRASSKAKSASSARKGGNKATRKVEDSATKIDVKTEEVKSEGIAVEITIKDEVKAVMDGIQVSAKAKVGSVGDSDSDSDSESDEEGMESAYERRRLANIRANQEFLAKINMQEALLGIAELGGPGANKARTPGSRASNGRKSKKREILPARPRSLRLQRKAPDGVQLPDPPPVAEPVQEHPRKPSGPLSVADAAAEEMDVEAFSSLKTLAEMDIWTCPDQCDEKYETITKSLSKLKLRADKVVKVVKERIFSVALHPNSERLLAVAGDKWGQLGFWDVHSTSSDHGISVYTPHSRPVNCLQFSRTNAGKLYSSSYDGTVRCCHFEKGQFEEVYRTSDEYEERCMAFDFLSPDSLMVSRNDGHVVRIDTRESSSKAAEFQTQDGGVVKCISVHPREQNYFITSDNPGNVCLFDLRQTGSNRLKPLQTLSHGRSVSSAYFSPITGKYVLTTSINDTVNIFDSSYLTKLTSKHKIRHDNHTGRWLTPFRAVWHPAREDVFVVGSMNRPRQIDLYNTSGQKFHILQNEETLGSVCSLNVLHPTIPAVVGANSSGKLMAFV